MTRGILFFITIYLSISQAAVAGSGVVYQRITNRGTEVDGGHFNNYTMGVYTEATELLAGIVSKSPYLKKIDRREEARQILVDGVFAKIDRETGELAPCFRRLEDGSLLEIVASYLRVDHKDQKFFESSGPKVLICLGFFEEIKSFFGEPQIKAVTHTVGRIAHELGHTMHFAEKGGAAEKFAKDVMCDFPSHFGRFCAQTKSSVFIQNKIPKIKVQEKLPDGSIRPVTMESSKTNRLKGKISSDFTALLADILDGDRQDKSFSTRATLYNSFTDIRAIKDRATHTLKFDEFNINFEKLGYFNSICSLELKISVINNLSFEVSDRRMWTVYVDNTLDCLKGNIPTDTFLGVFAGVFSEIRASHGMVQSFRMNFVPEVKDLKLSGEFDPSRSEQIGRSLRALLQSAIREWTPDHQSPFWDIADEFALSRDPGPDFYPIELSEVLVGINGDDLELGLRLNPMENSGQVKSDSLYDSSQWTTGEVVKAVQQNDQALVEQAFQRVFDLYKRKTEEVALFGSKRACEFTLNKQGLRFSKKPLRSLVGIDMMQYYEQLGVLTSEQLTEASSSPTGKRVTQRLRPLTSLEARVAEECKETLDTVGEQISFNSENSLLWTDDGLATSPDSAGSYKEVYSVGDEDLF